MKQQIAELIMADQMILGVGVRYQETAPSWAQTRVSDSRGRRPGVGVGNKKTGGVRTEESASESWQTK